MVVVDSHVHVGLRKYVPAEVLLAQMEVAGIQKAVLVQYMGEADNCYLQEVCARHPGRFAPWGFVDTEREDAVARFAEAVEQHEMVGFRASASARSRGSNPFAFWQKLEELGVVVSLCGRRDDFASPDTADLIERHPGLKFRIEHLGHPRFDEDQPYPIYREVLKLSRFPNVTIAYSGLYAAGKSGFPYDDLVPFLRMIYDAFGPRRIMWGSDFPPVVSHETVAMNLRLFQDGLGLLTEEDQEWILGRTAMEFTDFV